MHSVPSEQSASGRLVPATIALVLAIGLILAGAPPGPALGREAVSATTCAGPWQPVGFPSTLAGMEPQSIATLNGSPAWVVGLASALVRRRGPMIAAWNGSGWERVPGPWKAYGILNAVEAWAPNRAWAVGSIGPYARLPISARWNGTAWQSVSVPPPAGQLATFADLALISRNKLWAVGSMLVDGRLKPLAMIRRSGAWRTRNPELPAAAEGGLADVFVAPGGRIWAAGWRTDESGEGRPFVTYRSAGEWRASSFDAVPPGRASIMDLTFRTAADGWAAGFVETHSQGYQPVLQHWNGTDWTAVDLAWAAGRSVILNAVAIDASGRPVVAGIEIGQLRRDVTAVLSDAGWTVTSLSGGTLENTSMNDLAALDAGVVATGTIDRQPITLFPCSAGWAGSADADAHTGSSAGIIDAPLTALPGEHDHADWEREQDATVDGEVGALSSVSVPGTVAADVTAAAGLQMDEFTWSGVAADFDNDGAVDLFINRHFNDLPLLMLNDGDGAFTERATNFMRVDRHRCAAGDVDHSGGVDLLCAVGVNLGTTNTPNELMLDLVDTGGTWASDSFGLLDGFGRGRDVALLNLDGDSWLDVFTASEPSRSDAMWSSNRLYRSRDGTGFVPAPEAGLDRAFGFGVALPADLDNDGDDDLLLRPTEPVDGLAMGARLFVNENGRFVDRTIALGVEMPGANEMEVADFDGDGRLDIAQLSQETLRVMLATDGPYQPSFELSVTSGVGMAVGDVDGDDRPDIYIARRVTGNAGNLMLVNRDDATTFLSMTIPQPGAGRADDVLALDYDGNGLSDFLTLNGWAMEGPVKLTAFFPES